MPVLELLSIKRCKLKHVPPGIASHARAVRKVRVYQVQHLSSLENFASLVELEVFHNPDLKRVANLLKLQKLTIVNCPKMTTLEGVPALQRLVLEDYAMETLPEYMQDIKPRHLQLDCRHGLLTSMATGQCSLEWDKFSHVSHVKAYAQDGNGQRKWYILYTSVPYNFETNISHSLVSEGTSLFSEEEQRFESALKMTRGTFNYICSLVKVPFLEDMMVMGSSCTFLDGRALSLEDQVAIALRTLTSGLPLETLVSSVGVRQPTISLVTSRFVVAMHKKASHRLRWPDSIEMEKIKSKFDNVYGLPNCCGVVDTTHIIIRLSSAEPNREVWLNHENNHSLVLQAVVDPDMRFTEIGQWRGSAKQPSILHNSDLFKKCEEGEWLNGSKLNASDGSEVREYIIGDSGYRLLPWLLTPYQGNDIVNSKAEFNRRHSVARAVALRALTRFKDTWKYLQGAMCCPENPSDILRIIHVCCLLHNIVIDMEGAAMEEMTLLQSDHEVNYSQQVCQVADENAARVRDVLSQLLTSRSSESQVVSGDEEEQEVVSSDSVDEEKQEIVPSHSGDEEKQEIVSSDPGNKDEEAH